jgi:ribosome maturation factor RimP
MLERQLSCWCEDTGCRTESGRQARFFTLGEEFMGPLQTEIEKQLSACDPRIEVLLAEVVGGSTLRIFIDHPDGVTLALCERVTAELAQLRERYTLEVSSPGSSRPLTKPAHFRRFVGRRARVRTSRPCTVEHSDSPLSNVSFTGELVGATDSEVTIAAESGVIAIPYSEIRRSNLVEE